MNNANPNNNIPNIKNEKTSFKKGNNKLANKQQNKDLSLNQSTDDDNLKFKDFLSNFEKNDHLDYPKLFGTKYS